MPRPRFPERRSGFDRRCHYPVLAQLRNDPLTLMTMLAAFVTLSLVDLELTWHELQSGIAVEGNPVMAALFAVHPSAAGAFKLAATVLVAAALWRLRRYRRILAVSVLAFAVYSALVLYHLHGLRAYALS